VDPPLTSAKLHELANVFDSQGLPKHAEILRKRAVMRDRPDSLKAQYRAAFRRAMNAKDPLVVRALATAFEAQGLTLNAQKLRDYAVGLDAAAVIPGPAIVDLPPPMEVIVPAVTHVTVTGDNPDLGSLSREPTDDEAAESEFAAEPPGNRARIPTGTGPSGPAAQVTATDPTLPYPDPTNAVQDAANGIVNTLDDLADDLS